MRDGQQGARGKALGYLAPWGLVALLLVAAYVAWVVLPVYYFDYAVGDKVHEIVRAGPASPLHPDGLLRQFLESLFEGSEDMHLDSLRIESKQLTLHVHLEYTHWVQVLPWWRLPIRFVHDVATPPG